MSASAARIDWPVSTRMSSSANTSFGFAIATTSWPLQRSTRQRGVPPRDVFGDQRREHEIGGCARGRRTGRRGGRRAPREARSSRSRRCSSRISPTRRPVVRCSASASSSCSSVTRPRSTINWPSRERPDVSGPRVGRGASVSAPGHRRRLADPPRQLSHSSIARPTFRHVRVPLGRPPHDPTSASTGQDLSARGYPDLDTGALRRQVDQAPRLALVAVVALVLAVVLPTIVFVPVSRFRERCGGRRGRGGPDRREPRLDLDGGREDLRHRGPH